MLILTYTTDEDSLPKAVMSLAEMPDDYADYIWQEAKDEDEAIRYHHLKLDLMNAEINLGQPMRDFY